MKRSIDIFFSALALLIFSPLILIVSLLIFLRMGRPIFFLQTRPGFRGKPFQIIKFRTMLAPKKSGEGLGSDMQRITSLGKILRALSIDELPELWNILKGDMSLVGPRPLLMEYIPLYTPEQSRRHDVKPGLTGWAQVNGRNALSWDDKFALDLWYVDNQSLSLDMRILFLTVKKVLIKEGINANEGETMNRFTGSVPKLDKRNASDD